jgi:hypothetical protein
MTSAFVNCPENLGVLIEEDLRAELARLVEEMKAKTVEAIKFREAEARTREKFKVAKQMVDIVRSVKLQVHPEKEMSAKQEKRGPKAKMSGKIMKIVLDLLSYAGSFKAVAPGWMVTDIAGKGLSPGKTDIWISAGLQQTEALSEGTQPKVTSTLAGWPADYQSSIKVN